MASGKLAFLLPEDQDDLAQMMAKIVGHPERLAEVRAYVRDRP